MDLQWFRLINDFAGQSSFLDAVFVFGSSYGLSIMIAIILSLLIRKQTRGKGAFGLLALACALLINRFLKETIERSRPFVDYDVTLLIERSPSPSFPSDQALICGVFVFLIWTIARKEWFFLALCFGLFVMVSRVFVGHHYPFDIIVGFCIGIFITYLVLTISKKGSSSRNNRSNKQLEM
ncbi:phosphatase PAP2 family protein [Halalkalibacter urbisdiaboli]|uniref:phosphatase PAP2 family protein n=1 Tax=Halalkalibacter urbisdiaboli TaxID=1960589 RepID=UPI000B42F7A7|nr:phosphatase PAP2 family protein [Halalkalibacter urbisdiaboli]